MWNAILRHDREADTYAIANGPIAYAEARELWPFRLHGAFTAARS
ncbi:MAG: hypothetical protein ABI461_12495 [Polyangiaceae bacterium]